MAMLVWILWNQIGISRARSDLASQEDSWKPTERTFLQVSNSYRESGMIRKRLASLESYSTNRFLWTQPLDALQYVADDRVRVVSLTGSSVSTQQNQIAFSTNLYFNLPDRKWWRLWIRGPLETNVSEIAHALLSAVTNRADFARFRSNLVIAPLTISTTSIQVAAQMEVLKPETMAEKITLTIRARDYTKPSGSRVDSFYAAVTNAPFLRQFLGKTPSAVQQDTIQPREDESDKINPSDPYIQFTIQGNFPDRVRSNE